MSDLQLKRDFNEIADEFLAGNFDPTTVSKIITLIREYQGKLSPEQVKILLEIPINVLENDVELINPDLWVSHNRGYFSGNITWVESEYFDDIKKRFATGNFGLGDIIELAKTVQNDYENLYSASEFLLRNVEVTLRDDVQLKGYTSFHKSGNVFSEQVKKAINLI